MSTEPRLIIFDCDGTLIDSQAIICAAMDAAFTAQGLEPLARARTLSIVGLSLPEAMAHLAPQISETGRAALAAAYKAAFGVLRKDPAMTEPLFPDTRETLDHLALDPANLMAMATGKSRRGVAAVIAHHGLEAMFNSTHTADDHPSKPHPEMVHSAMEKAGVEARRTIMVGDTTFDIEMAVSAGAIPIGVDWGYHPVQALRKAGARTVISRFVDLPGAIDDALAVNGVVRS